MVLEDFEFNGERLSNKNCVICAANTSNNDSISMGSSLSFDSITNNATHITENLRADYPNNISCTFDIMKSDCVSGTEKTFTQKEISHFRRWLNSKTNQKFIPIYDEEKFDVIYYYGTFTDVDAIYIGGEIIGLTLSFLANAPWGYQDNTTFTATIDDGGGTFTIYDDADEVGFSYPESIIITCNESGDLTLNNSLDEHSFVLNNVTSGEVLTIDCRNKILTSSITHDGLYNDFNYRYPRIVTTTTLDPNIFTSNLGCDVEIIYSSIRKVGIIV